MTESATRAGLRNLQVRAFAADDAAELTELVHAAYAELGRMGLNFTAIDQDVRTTLFRASGGASWLAVEDGALIGTITMSVPPGKQLRTLSAEARVPGRVWLNQLAVHPERRGEGIASRLWAIGREWALAEGATEIGIDTAAPATHLIELYTRWGFEPRETIQRPGKTYASTVMVWSQDRCEP